MTGTSRWDPALNAYACVESAPAGGWVFAMTVEDGGFYLGYYFENCVINAPPDAFAECCFYGCTFLQEPPTGANNRVLPEGEK